jgi:hypothetical protein
MESEMTGPEVEFVSALVLITTRKPLLAVAIPRSWRVWWRRGRPRPSIRARLRRRVYAADNYHCVYCWRTVDLQLDHVRPWSTGGLSSLWNLVTLCGSCNRAKSNYWQYRNGRIVFRLWTYDDVERMPTRYQLDIAAAILARERRARRNPLRWLRAAAAR